MLRYVCVCVCVCVCHFVLLTCVTRIIIPQLLQSDASWITHNVVERHLVRQRQDLLTPFLSCPLVTGRRYSGKNRFMFSFNLQFDRLTYVQQSTLAVAVAELIEVNVHAVMNTLGHLELIEPTTLIHMSRVDNPEKVCLCPFACVCVRFSGAFMIALTRHCRVAGCA